MQEHKTIAAIDKTALVDAARSVINTYSEKLTLRQVYYRLVAAQVIPNNISQYKRLSDVLARAREEGLISWDALEDRGRDVIGEPSIGDGDDPHMEVAKWLNALENSSGIAMPRWWEQKEYIEVWLEKQALERIFASVCERHEVVLMPCKGYPSATFIWEAGQRLQEVADTGRKLHVVYFGDFDPSGKDIERYVTEKLRVEHGIELDSFERVAITAEQIEALDLPPAPTKVGDSRSAAFIEEHGDNCVELDAIDPPQLKELIEQHIVPYFDQETKRRRDIERANRSTTFRKLLMVKVKELVDRWESESSDDSDEEEDEDEEDDEE